MTEIEQIEMGAMSGQNWMGDMPEQTNLVVNTNHPISARILKARGKQEKMVEQLYDLALLSQGMLKGQKLTDFVSRSVGLMD